MVIYINMLKFYIIRLGVKWMKYKMLVIDDEISIVSLLKDFFEIEGFLVYTACNGKEALNKININTYIIYIHMTHHIYITNMHYISQAHTHFINPTKIHQSSTS